MEVCFAEGLFTYWTKGLQYVLCSMVQFWVLAQDLTLKLAVGLRHAGGEDGYVRVHHFDMDYFTTRFF